MSCPPPALAVHTGQPVIHDPLNSRDLMVYHYVPNDAEVGGLSYLDINYLDFNGSGRPEVVH